MKASFESIYLEDSKSLKIETYDYTSLCNSVNWHLHPEYEIVFIRNGQGTVRVDKYSEPYSDGILIFLGPNIPHMPFGNKQFKSNAEIVIQFSEAFVKEKLAHFPEFEMMIHFIQQAPYGILFSSETHRKLASSFLKFKQQNDTEKLLNFVQILYQLSISEDQRNILKSKHTIDINKHSSKRISTVFQYINEHYDKEIRSHHIANQLGLTPNSFCRMFKASTNQSFISFLNEFRIKKAQEYFTENKNIAISEVMYRCGFNDPSYFSRQFKKYTGLLPNEYLKLELN